MALSKKQVKDVCFYGGGTSQCRYLDDDFNDNGNIVWICKKKSPDKKLIDEEVDLYLIDMKKKGIDPMDQGASLGDNCQGYLPLKSISQGYDVP